MPERWTRWHSTMAPPVRAENVLSALHANAVMVRLS